MTTASRPDWAHRNQRCDQCRLSIRSIMVLILIYERRIFSAV
jgi:hypothetical protein